MCWLSRGSLRWRCGRVLRKHRFISAVQVSLIRPQGLEGIEAPSRLQSWLRLQSHTFREADGLFPSKVLRRDAAKEAARLLGEEDREIFLEPEEFLHLLKDTVLCPAFSMEVLQRVYQHRLFCSPSSFGGCRLRRQFFRNQVLYLYAEQALLVRNCFHMLAEGVPSRLQGDIDLFEFEAVLNCVTTGSNESEQEAQEAPHSVPAAFGHQEGPLADFLVDASQAEILAASGQNEVFFLHYSGPRSEQPQWMLGISNRVVAPMRSDVFLLSLWLYPVVSDANVVADFTKGDVFKVVPVEVLPVVLNRQVKAIMALCNRDSRVTPFVESLIFGDALAEEQDLEVSPSLPELNEQQRAAVAHAASQQLTLVQGPPGTGKSDVAVAIVEQWLRQNPERSILMATGTHAAKDVLRRRFASKGIAPLLKPRGVGDDAASQEVFVETVYMAAEPEDRKLQRVVLDESSQITTAAALVALTRGCEQLVLIGDPKQLGPISSFGADRLALPEDSEVLGPFSEERQGFFEVVRRSRREAKHMLQVQYRMQPQICEYPSQRFYNGELQTSPSVICRAPGNVLPEGFTFKDGPRDHPVIFVDSAGLNFAEELVRRSGSASLQNPLEAQVVAALLRSLQATLDPMSISVMAAYTAQINLLGEVVHGSNTVALAQQRKGRSMMIRLHGIDPLADEPHPRFHTVDGFQGNENDVVIFSAVRSNPNGITGFLGQRQRLCVLLTRARHKLVIVGDSSTLQHDEEWGSWLRDAAKETFTLDQQTTQHLQRLEELRTNNIDFK